MSEKFGTSLANMENTTRKSQGGALNKTITKENMAKESRAFQSRPSQSESGALTTGYQDRNLKKHNHESSKLQDMINKVNGSHKPGSRKQLEILQKFSKAPVPKSSPQRPATSRGARGTSRVGDTRPKGKTYRKAHNDPREVEPEKAREKLDRRLRRDSKCGALSKSRIFSKGEQR